MSELNITRGRIYKGVWQGTVSGPAEPEPNIKVTYLDKAVAGVAIVPADEPGTWTLSVPIPTDAISDGVQTFLITDAVDGSRLEGFTLIAGEPMADDIRAEVDLLRAELDMLKRAFRRHCVETA